MRRIIFLLFLSSACFATNLDLPGSFSVEFDKRMDNSTMASDNKDGRMMASIEQAISTEKLTKYIQAYAGLNYYAPNMTASTDNYGIAGLNNHSLFSPVVLSIEYQYPFTQSADQISRFVFKASYNGAWNFNKKRKDE